MTPSRLRTNFRRGYKEVYNLSSAWISCIGIARKNPILVYQMGKVGSTSVVRSLENLDEIGPVYHCHTLNQDHIIRAIAKNRQSVHSYVPRHLFVSRYIRRAIDRQTFPCRLISLTREPVARAISFVFENWRLTAPAARDGQELKPEIISRALEDLLRTSNGVADPSIWFDSEIAHVFGIDVFSVPFDFERGYNIFHNDNVDLLLLRMEDLNRVLPEALGAFLGLDPDKIVTVRGNAANKKWYAKSMSEFKEKYPVSPDLRQRLLQTKYARHFYPHPGDTETIA